MSKEFKFICNENEIGTRLDVFLFNSMKESCNELISRNRIKSLIENNYVEKDNIIIRLLDCRWEAPHNINSLTVDV